MNTMVLSHVGGLFAILVFWHFFADWVFQSNKEALAKAKNHWIRARHCLVYAVLFIPLFWICGVADNVFVTSMIILFGSHFIIDTYIPVMLWAKYLRRAPQFSQVVSLDEYWDRKWKIEETTETLPNGSTITSTKVVSRMSSWQDKVIDDAGRVIYKNDGEAFEAFAHTPIGLVLMITMDQFLHIAFLLPIAWIMLNR